jgi:hypothetical protein
MEETSPARSTPLNQLPQGNENSDDDTQFVDKILQKMETDNNEVEQQYDNQQEAYNQQQFGLSPEQLGYQQQQQQQQYYPDEQQMQMQQQYMQQQQMPEPTLSFADKVKSSVKQPLIFLVLYVVLSAPPLRALVQKQLERFTQKPFLQLWGSTLLLGLIGGVLFFVANQVI